MKGPIDSFPYPRDARSKPISTALPDGPYVYVRDWQGVIHVMRDGPNRHPRVLGGAEPAIYAGDLTIRNGEIEDVTNLSGTFQFDDSKGLLDVADMLIELGFRIEPMAVRLFPLDGSRPMILR